MHQGSVSPLADFPSGCEDREKAELRLLLIVEFVNQESAPLHSASLCPVPPAGFTKRVTRSPLLTPYCPRSPVHLQDRLPRILLSCDLASAAQATIPLLMHPLSPRLKLECRAEPLDK